MRHLLQLEKALLVKVDALKVQHTFVVEATASIYCSKGLQELVGDLDELLLCKVSVFGLFCAVDVHQTGVVGFRHDVYVPLLWR